jgi:hypothetical protein
MALVDWQAVEGRQGIRLQGRQAMGAGGGGRGGAVAGAAGAGPWGDGLLAGGRGSSSLCCPAPSSRPFGCLLRSSWWAGCGATSAAACLGKECSSGAKVAVGQGGGWCRRRCHRCTCSMKGTHALWWASNATPSQGRKGLARGPAEYSPVARPPLPPRCCRKSGLLRQAGVQPGRVPLALRHVAMGWSKARLAGGEAGSMVAGGVVEPPCEGGVQESRPRQCQRYRGGAKGLQRRQTW